MPQATAEPPAAAPNTMPAATQPPAQPVAAPALEPKASPTILGGEPPKPGEQINPGNQLKTGAPDKYADFKLPDGMTFDQATRDKFTGTAKEIGLSQENAQKLVDLQAQYAKGQYDAAVAETYKTIEGWRDESKAFFGAEYEKQFGIASKAIERFGTPALRQLLQETGLGNHKELVAAFAKIGSELIEDQPVEGRRAGGENISTAELLYGGSMGSKK